MRTIVLNSKTFPGEHFVYSDKDEARYYLSGSHKHKNQNNQDLSDFLIWHYHEGIAGDWVVSDDGKIVQILYKLRRQSSKNGKPRFFRDGRKHETEHYKFAFCNAARWTIKDGTWNCTPVIAEPRSDLDIIPRKFTKQGREMSINLGKLGKYKKQLFAYYVSQTADPPEALRLMMMAFQDEKKIQNFPAKFITISATELLTDQIVINQLQIYITDMEDFRAKLKASVNNRGLSVDVALDTIVDVMTHSKSGMAKLKAAEMTLNIHKYIEGNSNDLPLSGDTGLKEIGIDDEQIPQISLPMPPTVADSKKVETQLMRNVAKIINFEDTNES